jgi:hypothetical protein
MEKIMQNLKVAQYRKKRIECLDILKWENMCF